MNTRMSFAGMFSEKEFNGIYAQYQGQVRKVISKVLAGRHYKDVDDVAQIVWLQVYNTNALLRDKRFLSGWLYRIAHNVAYSHVRAENKHCGGSRISLDGTVQLRDRRYEPSLDPVYLSLEERLKTLPADDCRLMQDIFIARIPYEEVARELHISVGTVKSRMSRLKQLIRERESTPIVARR